MVAQQTKNDQVILMVAEVLTPQVLAQRAARKQLDPAYAGLVQHGLGQGKSPQDSEKTAVEIIEKVGKAPARMTADQAKERQQKILALLKQEEEQEAAYKKLVAKAEQEQREVRPLMSTEPAKVQEVSAAKHPFLRDLQIRWHWMTSGVEQFLKDLQPRFNRQFAALALYLTTGLSAPLETLARPMFAGLNAVISRTAGPAEAQPRLPPGTTHQDRPMGGFFEKRLDQAERLARELQVEDAVEQLEALPDLETAFPYLKLSDPKHRRMVKNWVQHVYKVLP
jgi:hypothetical protein